MKCKIPEISWHNRDPVLSVDIQPNTESIVAGNNTAVRRLASGGTDAHVLIWYMHFDATSSNLDVELAADLNRHQRAVNVVKWSPNGQLLASGDDESVIFIWKQKSDTETLNICESTNDEDKEVWLTMKILRGHVEDVYDLSWSPDSLYLVSGSVDNTALLWNINKGKSIAILNDHKGFVQGVAWDPLNQYIATLSTDRHLRIFDIQTRKVVQRVHKCTLPVPSGHELFGREVRLYHDDTLQTFFRRLTFTPDGKLLITPSGLAEHESLTQLLHTSYVYSRYSLKQPAIVLPSPEEYTVAVRCCPVLFKLRPNGPNNLPVVPLPYRMIFAVATRCSLFFYDTQQSPPFALISNIHYTRLTDITWSSDGRIVIVSSTDGFCSLITFDEGELGEVYEETAAMILSKEESVINSQTTKKTPKNQANRNQKKVIPKSPKLETANKDSTQIADAPKKTELTSHEKSPTITEIRENNDKLATVDKTTNSEEEVKKSKVDDKYETPKKKQRYAKPIEVRRQPRIPVVINKPIEVITVEDDEDKTNAVQTPQLENPLPIVKKSEDEKFENNEKSSTEQKESTCINIVKENELETKEDAHEEKDLITNEQIENNSVKVEENSNIINETEKNTEEKQIKEAVTEENLHGIKKVKEQNTLEEENSKQKNDTENKTEGQQIKETLAAPEKNLEEISSVEEETTSVEENSKQINDTENNAEEKQIKGILATVEENLNGINTVEEESAFLEENSKQLKDTENNAEEKEVKETLAAAEENLDEISTVEEQTTCVEENSKQMEDNENNAEEKEIPTSAQGEEAIEQNVERITNDKSLKKIDVENENKDVVNLDENQIEEKAAEILSKSNQENKIEGKEESIEKIQKQEEEDTKLEGKSMQEPKEERTHDVSPTINNQEEEQNSSNTSLTAQQISKTLTPQPHFTPPSERTPRRVALRTISTPKSKKKILD